jgi:NTE family protein
MRRPEDAVEERSELPAIPSIYEVIVGSVNIMQARITRSRMAGDPPDLLVAPRLDDFALLDFDRAAEAIDAGRRAVAVALATGRELPQA